MRNEGCFGSAFIFRAAEPEPGVKQPVIVGTASCLNVTNTPLLTQPLAGNDNSPNLQLSPTRKEVMPANR